MISGLVAHLNINDNAADELRRRLASHSAFEPGKLQGNRLPLVLEAADRHDSEQWTEWLQRQPGVVHVDITFVDWTEDSQPDNDLNPPGNG